MSCRRILRWVPLVALVATLWACTDRPLTTPDSPPQQEISQVFVQSVNRAIDILFVVDNSTSMTEAQANLVRNFPVFMNVLKALPGGLPDVHVGVISTNLGGGGVTDVPGCPPGGDRGALQRAPRGGMGRCPAVPRDNYISSLAKGTMNNFAGDIADVFSCIAELGVGGCGFEQPLAAAARALGAPIGGYAGGAPTDNTGFLRDDAYLALVFLTNEDDCSVPANSDLFDTHQNALSDALGPLASYRCNEFGHLCGGARPPRSEASNLQGCHSAEGAGKLIPVTELASFFRSLKRRRDQVFVAALAGPPEPYSVTVDEAGRPCVAASCTSANGSAAPGVRMKEFVDAFDEGGTFSTICEDNFGPSMDRIARKLGKIIRAHCLEGVLLDTDPARDGVQADCQVVDQTPTASGVAETPLANCDVGAPPCWRLESNPRDCTISGFELKIDRGAQVAPPGTTAMVKCATCVDPEGDPRCRQ